MQVTAEDDAPAEPLASAAGEAAPMRALSLSVFLNDLKVEAEIGLYPQERNRRQTLIVDMEATLYPAVVGRIGDTVDYDFLAASARDAAAGGHIGLVEHYVQRVASACLSNPRIERIRLRVQKPNAVPGASPGVEAEFDRGLQPMPGRRRLVRLLDRLR